MKRPNKLGPKSVVRGVTGALFTVAVGLFAGCGAPPDHPLTIVSYQDIGCNPMTDSSCIQFLGCSDLGIDTLNIAVGVFTPETITMPCPADVVSGQSQSNVEVMVPYSPGQDFYMVDANFTRGGSIIYLNAGPFTEDNTATPWRLVLR